jgi:hypothetical protein
VKFDGIPETLENHSWFCYQMGTCISGKLAEFEDEDGRFLLER